MDANPESLPAAADPTRPSLARHLLRSAPVIVALALLGSLVQHLGWLRTFETAALDTALRLKAPLQPSFVQVVGITESDYREIFAGRSPLAQNKVLELIDAIAKGGPERIVVDIDTSEWVEPVNLKDVVGDVPVVWARELEEVAQALHPRPVFPGASPPVSFGAATFPIDWDGVIRRYRRVFHTTEGPMASLAWAAVPGHEREDAGTHVDEDLTLNFTGDQWDLQPLPASHVLKAAQGPAWPSSVLKGKTVIVGGVYRAARDTYFTPLGPFSGVQLVALAIESERQNRGIRPVNEVKMFLIELLGAFGIAALHFVLRPALAFWVSLAAIPLLTLAGSLVAFSAFAYWVSFVPAFFGTLLDQLYERTKEHLRLRRELESLRAQVAAAAAS